MHTCKCTWVLREGKIVVCQEHLDTVKLLELFKVRQVWASSAVVKRVGGADALVEFNTSCTAAAQISAHMSPEYPSRSLELCLHKSSNPGSTHFRREPSSNPPMDVD